MENKVNTSDVSPGVQCLSRRWHQWPACWHGNSCHHIVPLRLGSIDVLLAAPKGSPEASLDPSALPCSSLRQHYMSHSPEAQFKTEIEQAGKKTFCCQQANKSQSLHWTVVLMINFVQRWN